MIDEVGFLNGIWNTGRFISPRLYRLFSDICGLLLDSLYLRVQTETRIKSSSSYKLKNFYVRIQTGFKDSEMFIKSIFLILIVCILPLLRTYAKKGVLCDKIPSVKLPDDGS